MSKQSRSEWPGPPETPVHYEQTVKGRVAGPSIAAIQPELKDHALVGLHIPDCLLIVYRYTRTHSPHPPSSLFAHSVPVYPYTLAASSSLTVCS